MVKASPKGDLLLLCRQTQNGHAWYVRLTDWSLQTQGCVVFTLSAVRLNCQSCCHTNGNACCNYHSQFYAFVRFLEFADQAFFNFFSL